MNISTCPLESNIINKAEYLSYLIQNNKLGCINNPVKAQLIDVKLKIPIIKETNTILENCTFYQKFKIHHIINYYSLENLLLAYNKFEEKQINTLTINKNDTETKFILILSINIIKNIDSYFN